MATSPYPIHPDYTALAIAYKNKSYIADAVLPRRAVNAETFTYLKFNMEGYTIPDLRVGRTSRVPEVTYNATEISDSVVDYGIESLIPYKDIKNSVNGVDPLAIATEGNAERLALAREKRVADLIFNAANYKVTTNKATLSSTTQWSDYTNSDPIKAIYEAMDGMIMRPNIMVIGRGAWSTLIRHPKIISAMYHNSGLYGVATKEHITSLFELDDVYVGESYINTAKKGQTVSLSRLWGKHCALLHRGRGLTETTFGFTAQHGDRVSRVWEDVDIGLQGGMRIRVGESVKELMSADDLGYLFTDAST